MTNPSKLEQVASTESIVERVGRAIYDARHGTFQDAARAAIAAMELPTEEMVAEGADVPCGFFHPRPSDAKRVYTAMIRAALKEAPMSKPKPEAK